MIAIAALYTVLVTGSVPATCGATLYGNVARHFCNVPGEYTVTVSSTVRFRYGERLLDAGTHTLVFVGPEQVDRIVEPVE